MPLYGGGNPREKRMALPVITMKPVWAFCGRSLRRGDWDAQTDEPHRSGPSLRAPSQSVWTRNLLSHPVENDSRLFA